MKIKGTSNSYPIEGSYIGNCTTRYKQGESTTCAPDMPVSIEYAVAACSNKKDNFIAWKFY